MAENPFDAAEFESNPERRCPVVLVLDTSMSMHGEGIRQVNDGLQRLERDLKADALASLRVEIGIVTFGGSVATIDVREGTSAAIQPNANIAFVTADAFQAPTLRADGDTPMGAGVRQGLELLRGRKAMYKQAGIPYFRPWLFLISDGQPTDRDWESAAADARIEESVNGVSVFPVGVDTADMEKLRMFSSERTPIALTGIEDFGKLFEWLSNSLAAVANSRPGQQVELPPVSGWATITP
jgi:uncharacterized protein YegL